MLLPNFSRTTTEKTFLACFLMTDDQKYLPSVIFLNRLWEVLFKNIPGKTSILNIMNKYLFLFCSMLVISIEILGKEREFTVCSNNKA